MKKILSTLFSLCLYVSLQAAEETPINVIIKDSMTNTTIPYASVFIRTPQDSTLQAGTTNDDGMITFKKIGNGNYKIRITAIGYQALDTIVSINKNQPFSLYLTPSYTELDEVTVTHTRKAYEQKYDRKVYTVTEAQQATARTVLDLLKALPGVIVNDEDKSITYRGGSPTMQVNDMPAEFMYPDLSVIPAEKVRKIELIDASNRGGGVLGGIINILLVKPNKEGLDGMLSSELKQAEVGHSFRQDHALNLNYGLGKTTLFGNFLYSDNFYKDLSSAEGYSQNEITDRENILRSNTVKRHDQALKGFLGAIRAIDSLKTEYYILGSGIISKKTSGNGYSLRGNTEYWLDSSNKGKDYAIAFGYGFIRKFADSDKFIQMSISGNAPQKGKGDGSSRYSYPDAPDLNIVTDSRSDGIFGAFDFYFNNPLKSGWNLSISENSTVSNSSSGSDRWSNGEVDVLNLANDKQLKWSNSLNINFGRWMNKIRLEAGVSFNHKYNTHDYTRYMVVEHDTLFANRKHFFSICPSLNFNWSVSETSDLSLKYGYLEEFPNIDNLTDYVDKRGVYNWSTGNPGLRSARYHSFALGYTFSKDTYNFSTEFVYKQSNNSIVTVGYYLPDNIKLSKPVNVGRTQDLGVILTNWIQLSPKLSMTNSATLNYKKLDQSNLKKEADAFGLEGEKFVFTQFNWDLSSYMTWSINKRNFASIRLNYYSKSLEYYGYRKQWLNSSINYTCKPLKNDRIKLMFGIDNLTAGLIDRVTVNNNMGVYTTNIEDPSTLRRTYKVAITYIFRKGDKGTKNFKY